MKRPGQIIMRDWKVARKQVQFTYDTLLNPPLQPGDTISIADAPFFITEVSEHSDGNLEVTAVERLVEESSLRAGVRATREMIPKVRTLLSSHFPAVAVTDEFVFSTVALIKQSSKLGAAHVIQKKCAELGVASPQLEEMIAEIEGDIIDSLTRTFKLAQPGAVLIQ